MIQSSFLLFEEQYLLTESSLTFAEWSGMLWYNMLKKTSQVKYLKDRLRIWFSLLKQLQWPTRIKITEGKSLLTITTTGIPISLSSTIC